MCCPAFFRNLKDTSKEKCLNENHCLAVICLCNWFWCLCETTLNMCSVLRVTSRPTVFLTQWESLRVGAWWNKTVGTLATFVGNAAHFQCSWNDLIMLLITYSPGKIIALVLHKWPGSNLQCSAMHHLSYFCYLQGRRRGWGRKIFHTRVQNKYPSMKYHTLMLCWKWVSGTDADENNSAKFNEVLILVNDESLARVRLSGKHHFILSDNVWSIILTTILRWACSFTSAYRWATEQNWS